ncbi:3'-5' exonuclease [Rhodococcus sp. WAY2]|uniref:3'-5' exonuclease n=1 Tax=Rhodococcus sp. WAY2 TaxID=2663121 RepID=UPI0013598F0D|nr:3'-5' exonuclease [Rhodococcus sp. WAY2]
MTAPESPAPSPRVGQVPHALSPRQWAQQMLRPGRAVVCDVESTDFDGAILEIAVIDAATGVVLLDTLVDPGAVPIHPAAAAVHGIDADQLVGAPDWAAVHPELVAVTAGKVTLAYNAEFDMGRILHDCHRYGLDPEHLADPQVWGCIMLARSQAEGVEKSIRLGAAHRARGDAEAARRVLQGIADGISHRPVEPQPTPSDRPEGAVELAQRVAR